MSDTIDPDERAEIYQRLEDWGWEYSEDRVASIKSLDRIMRRDMLRAALKGSKIGFWYLGTAETIDTLRRADGGSLVEGRSDEYVVTRLMDAKHNAAMIRNLHLSERGPRRAEWARRLEVARKERAYWQAVLYSRQRGTGKERVLATQKRYLLLRRRLKRQKRLDRWVRRNA